MLFFLENVWDADCTNDCTENALLLFNLYTGNLIG